MSNGKYPPTEWTFRGLLRNTKRDGMLAGVASLVLWKDLKFRFPSYTERRFYPNLHFFTSFDFSNKTVDKHS